MKPTLRRVVLATVVLVCSIALWMQASKEDGRLRLWASLHIPDKAFAHASGAQRSHERRNGALTECGDGAGAAGKESWQTFPQCDAAQYAASESPRLPPIADVFATGTPCARDAWLTTHSERVRLTPTVHFVLDLSLPDEGRRTDEKYNDWFPESQDFSAKEYGCEFDGGQASAVRRTSNHDKALWPEVSDCSRAARYRSVVLMCDVPSLVAERALAAVRNYSGRALSLDVKAYVERLFQVRLVRAAAAAGGQKAEHAPVAFACPLLVAPSSVIVKQPVYIQMMAAQRVTDAVAEVADDAAAAEADGRRAMRQGLSVGLCTMLDKACGLEEWLEYNLFIGVANAYLYDNSRTPEAAATLAGRVHDWNRRHGRAHEEARRFALVVHWHLRSTGAQWWVGQSHGINSCVRRFGPRHQWIIVSDTDERMVPLDLPARPRAYESVVGRLIGRLDKRLDRLDSRSSLMVSNWDMSASGERKVGTGDDNCFAAKTGDGDGNLLVELGDMQCAGGASTERMKSVMNADWSVNQIVDQGHCTVIGKPPVQLSAESEIRMNHYFSSTMSRCSGWEKAAGGLLTSQKHVHAYLRKRLGPATGRTTKH